MSIALPTPEKESIIHLVRYCNFIKSREIRYLSKNIYTEDHHILPKSMGGLDDCIIPLTAKEHYIAHLILWKCYGGMMATAFWRMSHEKTSTGKYGKKLTARQVKKLKEDFSNRKKEIKGKLHPNFGKHWSEETKRKIGLKAEQNFKGERNPFYGKHHTKETKLMISNKKKGRYIGDKNPMYGKNSRDYMTEKAKIEHDKKISKANKGNNRFKNKSEEEMMTIKEKMKKAKDGIYFGSNNPHAKKVICVETNEIFFTIKEAADNKKMDYRGISQCCNHPKTYKSAKGLHWKFLD
jgi:NUMOD3 motif